MASTLGSLAMIATRIQGTTANIFEAVHRLDKNISGTGLKRHTLSSDLEKNYQFTERMGAEDRIARVCKTCVGIYIIHTRLKLIG